ncbi:MAG: PilZ domain-containing protein [Verrucomicrobia bacterium]|nr:PilZ domain-containing protein [Verrucomicrobiota bacterium]
MSASKLDTSGVFHPVTVQARETQLTLPASAVRIRPNGVEFRSDTPLPVWTEMTVAWQYRGAGRNAHCTGVVVACQGSRHTGYRVSMVFMNLSRQLRERLSHLADAQLAY